ncbi:hypothetical protein SN15_02675 [Stenotrophomonas maltophilia]|nr:hypothetical protein SN15_02675 [Stenotrophomonas maltophilia]
MKVLYIVEGPAPYGANRSLLSLIDYGLSRGIEPLVVGSRRGPFSEWIEARGIPFRAIGHRFSIYPRAHTLLRKLFFLPIFIGFRIINLIALFRLASICRKFKPDVIHTNIGPVSLGHLASKMLGIAHIWHLREYQDLDFGMKFFPSKPYFQRLIASSTHVICVTDAIAEHFGRPGNATVINNGVAPRDAAVLKLPKSDHFLFVGRLEPAKQASKVIRAYIEYAKTSEHPLRLLLAGDGDTNYINSLKELASRVPSGACIEFLGFRNDTSTLMQGARALIVASDNEGFGRITAEAMFNGCLVIGKASGGTADILDADQPRPLGLLFDTQSELSLRLSESAEMDLAEYEFRVLKAQQKAMAYYSTELYGKKILEIYASLESAKSAERRDGVRQ